MGDGYCDKDEHHDRIHELVDGIEQALAILNNVNPYDHGLEIEGDLKSAIGILNRVR